MGSSSSSPSRKLRRQSLILRPHRTRAIRLRSTFPRHQDCATTRNAARLSTSCCSAQIARVSPIAPWTARYGNCVPTAPPACMLLTHAQHACTGWQGARTRFTSHSSLLIYTYCSRACAIYLSPSLIQTLTNSLPLLLWFAGQGVEGRTQARVRGGKEQEGLTTGGGNDR
jgi:hypothetical protein